VGLGSGTAGEVGKQCGGGGVSRGGDGVGAAMVAGGNVGCERMKT
jgi:hypothetical protein